MDLRSEIPFELNFVHGRIIFTAKAIGFNEGNSSFRTSFVDDLIIFFTFSATDSISEKKASFIILTAFLHTKTSSTGWLAIFRIYLIHPKVSFKISQLFVA